MFYILLVVTPAGFVSTWITDDVHEASSPLFGPRRWQDALELLPVTATEIHVRIEANAVQWPDRIAGKSTTTGVCSWNEKSL